MEYTNFAPLARRASAIGFGCAPMGSRYSKRESLRALAVAYELGINYFDVARAYGHGDAESILASFIRDKRDHVIVATKFGMEAPRATPARRLVKAAARRIFRVIPQLRTAARRQLGGQFTSRQFDVGGMTRSVEESLRQLKTDRIDVLLVHDCTLEAISDDGLFVALEQLVSAGKVLSLGISGDRVVVEAGVRRRAQVSVAQFHHDLFEPSLNETLRSSERLASVAFHPFGGETGVHRLRHVIRHVRSDAATPNELRRKLRASTEDEIISAVSLSGAWMHSGISVVLTTMFSPSHIEANARAIGSTMFTDIELAQFREVARNSFRES